MTSGEILDSHPPGPEGSRAALAAGLTAAVLVAGGLGALIEHDVASHNPPGVVRVIDGTVTCPPGQPVEGVWVDSLQTPPGFAGWHRLASANVVRFSFRATVQTPVLQHADLTYGINAGCGGDRQHWRQTDYSPFTSSAPGSQQNFVCDDKGGCEVSGSKQ